MNIKQYKQVRVVVALFISFIVASALTRDSNLLAIIAVFTGMLFMTVARKRTKIMVDEREKTIREKAAQMTYAIFTPTIGLGSFFLFILSSRNPYPFLFSLGQVLAYLTLFILALYSILYHFLNRKYGGSDE